MKSHILIYAFLVIYLSLCNFCRLFVGFVLVLLQMSCLMADGYIREIMCQGLNSTMTQYVCHIITTFILIFSSMLSTGAQESFLRIFHDSTEISVFYLFDCRLSRNYHTLQVQCSNRYFSMRTVGLFERFFWPHQKIELDNILYRFP